MSFVQSALRFVDGMTRCAKERYRVQLRDLARDVTIEVANPAATYYADPFVLEHGGVTWLFVEAFHCPSNRGHIAAAAIGADLPTAAMRPALDPGCHTSFPYVFAHDGAVYMLPELTHAGCVDLYVCERMPDRWRRVSRLLDHVDCADSVLYRREGVWYLLTSQKAAHTSGGRALAIYTADDLMSHHWKPHPINREALYATATFGYGRNAGALIDADGALLRPMQASTSYYGERARLMRITELSPESYSEALYDGDHIAARIASAHSTHHVSVCSNVVAWDTRTRAGYFRGALEHSHA